jgi:hypothetical protein
MQQRQWLCQTTDIGVLKAPTPALKGFADGQVRQSLGDTILYVDLFYSPV